MGIIPIVATISFSLWFETKLTKLHNFEPSALIIYSTCRQSVGESNTYNFSLTTTKPY